MLAMSDATAILINGGWIFALVSIAKITATVILKYGESKNERDKTRGY